MEEITFKEAIDKIYDVLEDIWTCIQFDRKKETYFNIYSRFETAVKDNDKKSLNEIADEIYMTYQKRPLTVPFEILDNLPNIDFEKF